MAGAITLSHNFKDFLEKTKWSFVNYHHQYLWTDLKTTLNILMGKYNMFRTSQAMLEQFMYFCWFG